MSFLTKDKTNSSGKPAGGTGMNMLMLCSNKWIAVIDGNAPDIELEFTDCPAEAATELARRLRAQNISSTEDITLALDASYFFTASINTSDLPKSAKRQGLVYRLEELLPIDAEHFTADFLAGNSSGANSNTLGVAVITEKVSAIVNALEANYLLITSIISSDIAVAYEILNSGSTKNLKNLDYLVFTDTNSSQPVLNIFCLSSGEPTKWLNCRSREAFERILRSELLHNPPEAGKKARVAVTKTKDFDITRFDNLKNENIELLEIQCKPYRDLLADALETFNSRIDLRRDKLAASQPWSRVSGHLKAAGVMLTVFLAVLLGAILHRGNCFNRQAAGYKHELRRRYSKLYPKTAPPANILGRLGSELEKLGAGTSDDEMPNESVFVTDNLRHLMANMPQDMRLRILNMAISPNNIVIDGQLRKHGDAERLREAIAGRFLSVDPPRTERLDSRSVSFTMTARPRLFSSGVPKK